MAQPRRRSNQNRNRAQAPRKQRPLDMWRPVPPLPPAEPIAAAPDPTALIRSLGDPPLRYPQADHYLAAVIERAAMLASALAASGGLLALPDAED